VIHLIFVELRIIRRYFCDKHLAILHETCETFEAAGISSVRPRLLTLACMKPFQGRTLDFPHTRERNPEMPHSWMLPGVPGNEHWHPTAMPVHLYIDLQEALGCGHGKEMKGQSMPCGMSQRK
jgi:hypothetical protein